MWPNPQFSADLVTFTEEILNGKIHFLYSDTLIFMMYYEVGSVLPNCKTMLLYRKCLLDKNEWYNSLKVKYFWIFP